jgi:hypothetical protein
MRIVHQGGKDAVVPLAPRTSRALDLYLARHRLPLITLNVGDFADCAEHDGLDLLTDTD